MAVLSELQRQIHLSLEPQEVSFAPQSALEAKYAMMTALVVRITVAISGAIEVAELGTHLNRYNSLPTGDQMRRLMWKCEE